MKRRAILAAGLACAFVVAPVGRAESVSVPVKGGSLLLDHPKGWKSSVSGPLVSPTLRLTSVPEGTFEVLILSLIHI